MSINDSSAYMKHTLESIHAALSSTLRINILASTINQNSDQLTFIQSEKWRAYFRQAQLQQMHNELMVEPGTVEQLFSTYYLAL